jgi:hypothetical protein
MKTFNRRKGAKQREALGVRRDVTLLARFALRFDSPSLGFGS